MLFVCIDKFDVMQQRATLAKAQGRLRRIGAWCDRNSRHNLTYRLDNAFAAYTIIVYASLSLSLSLSLAVVCIYTYTVHYYRWPKRRARRYR